MRYMNFPDNPMWTCRPFRPTVADIVGIQADDSCVFDIVDVFDDPERLTRDNYQTYRNREVASWRMTDQTSAKDRHVIRLTLVDL